MQNSRGSSLALGLTLGRTVLPLVLLVAACGVGSKDGGNYDPPGAGSSTVAAASYSVSAAVPAGTFASPCSGRAIGCGPSSA
jgi:hypothetical protein